MTDLRIASGFGLLTSTDSGEALDTWYPTPALGPAPASAPPGLAELAGTDPDRGVRRSVVRTEIELSTPPASLADAYLRLHLLSHRLVAPHGLNLEGIFGVLANVVWTSAGPCS
ncbi:MAG: 2,3,4,5-tetrahydropyridine-2,6-dicarboxylate N-succinyltransferase, partial [Angustibacter sp.]